jgi:hypothetical protein
MPLWLSEGVVPRALRKEHEIMSDETNTDAHSGANLRAAVAALLKEDLNDRELVTRLRALLPPSEEREVLPTTDDAVDHPGYQ